MSNMWKYTKYSEAFAISIKTNIMQSQNMQQICKKARYHPQQLSIKKIVTITYLNPINVWLLQQRSFLPFNTLSVPRLPT